jgi:predicted thioredoxin/glutaredoxin
MIPALAIEYFLNNRIQTEMIFTLLKSKEIVPDEENFLRCLSGIDKDNMDVNDKMVNGILTSSALLARDSFYSTLSHILDTTPAGQLSITRNALNTLLSAMTSYIETRSIATATAKIYNLEEGI